MVYAGFWRRALGLVLDGVVVAVISGLLSLFGINSAAIYILISLLYQPFFESSRLEGTPGKHFMGLRVTTLAGERITFKTAFVRYLCRIVSGMILFIGYFMNLFTEKRQTFHDLVANTVVIEGEVKGENIFEAWYDQVCSVLGMTDKVPDRPATGYNPGPFAAPAAQTSPAASPSSTATATPADLAGLYELYQKGILTEAEYNEKRAELLKRL